MSKRYEAMKDGEWISPSRKRFKFMCCDCSLVHRFEFRLVPWGKGKEIQFRVFRDERATAAARKAR